MPVTPVPVCRRAGSAALTVLARPRPPGRTAAHGFRRPLD